MVPPEAFYSGITLAPIVQGRPLVSTDREKMLDNIERNAGCKLAALVGPTYGVAILRVVAEQRHYWEEYLTQIARARDGAKRGRPIHVPIALGPDGDLHYYFAASSRTMALGMQPTRLATGVVVEVLNRDGLWVLYPDQRTGATWLLHPDCAVVFPMPKYLVGVIRNAQQTQPVFPRPAEDIAHGNLQSAQPLDDPTRPPNSEKIGKSGPPRGSWQWESAANAAPPAYTKRNADSEMSQNGNVTGDFLVVAVGKFGLPEDRARELLKQYPQGRAFGSQRCKVDREAAWLRYVYARHYRARNLEHIRELTRQAVQRYRGGNQPVALSKTPRPRGRPRKKNAAAPEEGAQESPVPSWLRDFARAVPHAHEYVSDACRFCGQTPEDS